MPLRLVFPLDGFVALPEGDRHVIRLELRIAAVDESGGRSEVDLLPVVLAGNRPPEEGQKGMQEVAVRLRRKKHDLVVSLHDPLSGTILVSRVQVPR